MTAPPVNKALQDLPGDGRKNTLQALTETEGGRAHVMQAFLARLPAVATPWNKGSLSSRKSSGICSGRD